MDHWTFVSLRLLHIFAGVFWAGAAIFLAFFLEPVISAAGPAGGSVMAGLTRNRHMGLYMSTAAWLTILAGIPVYWRISGHLNGAWIRSDPGLTYTVAALFALAALLLGMFVNAPVSKRMGMIGASLEQADGPPPPELLAEMDALRHRMTRAALISASLLILATAGMGVARYV
jgi:uncharacterized membrane protein